jgi:hypothetical protein
VQNEKMASLGNLVAGVAHEMNNLTDFLNGSINACVAFPVRILYTKLVRTYTQVFCTTFLSLKYRLKANEHHPAVQAIKGYGDVAPIECFPGQLNQVFMKSRINPAYCQNYLYFL